MTESDSPVSDDDLHAYVDGQLAFEDYARIERHLVEHPEAAARIDAWRRGRNALQRALEFKQREPIPSTLNLANMKRRSRVQPHWRFERMAASIFLALCVGVGAGWLAHGSIGEHGLAGLSKQAMISERVFGSGSQLVSFQTDEKHQLGFTGDKLSRTIRAPDLVKSGYLLLGVHAVPTEQGSAYLFIYKNAAGDHISLFTRLMVDKDKNAPMRPVIGNGMYSFVWSKDGVGFSLITRKPNEALHDLSNQIRDEMDT